MLKNAYILLFSLCYTGFLNAQDSYTYDELMQRIGHLESYMEKYSTIDPYAIPEGFQVKSPEDLRAFNGKLEDVLTMTQMANELIDYFDRYVEKNSDEDVLSRLRSESEKSVGPKCFRVYYSALNRNYTHLLSHHTLHRTERTVPILEYLLRQAGNYSTYQDCMSTYKK